MREFRGGVAVVTGAGGGIGQAVAVRLAKDGVKAFALLDVNRKGLDETKSLILDIVREPQILNLAVDVTSRNDIASARSQVEEEFGRATFLFNIAGVGGMNVVPFLDESAVEKFDKCLHVNLHGVIDVTRAFLPLILMEPWGCVVNVSSMAGLAALPGLLDYSTTKFGVRGFTEALMMQLREEHPNVTVHVVHPGHVGTDIAFRTLEQQLADGKLSPENFKADQLAILDKFRRGRGMPDTAPLPEVLLEATRFFRDKAPTSAHRAAKEITESVRRGRWKILVGPDSRSLDVLYRASPSAVYSLLTSQRLKQLAARDPPETRTVLVGAAAAVAAVAAVAGAGTRLVRARL